MKHTLIKSLAAFLMAISLMGAATSASASWGCYWHNGHRVCWHNFYPHYVSDCRWIPGHYNGVYWVPAHRECWR